MGPTTTTAAPIPPRATRRRDIVLVIAAYAALAAFTFQLGEGWAPIRELTFLGGVILLAWLGGYKRVFRPAQVIANPSTACGLDERQLALRQRAYTRAYNVLGPVTLIALLYAEAAQGTRAWLPQTFFDWQLVFWTVWGVWIGTPSAVLSWEEPDPQPDVDDHPALAAQEAR